MEERLDRVHHVAVTVADLKKAIQWYQTSFFCTVAYEDERQAVLQFENIRVLLLLPSHEPTHLAFYRKDAKLFGELRKQRDGGQQTVIADPTGNMVKLVCSDEDAKSE